MKVAAAALLFATVSAMASTPAQAQQCPIGSYASVDRWGNSICKRIGDGGAATTQVPRGQTCPIGAYPTVDSWGNSICRSSGGGNQPRTDYYDTSKGCPVGTYPSVDKWGNNACHRF